MDLCGAFVAGLLSAAQALRRRESGVTHNDQPTIKKCGEAKIL